jgi:protein-S-isoprenylcysteine O-methyltransferase Ste14
MQQRLGWVLVVVQFLLLIALVLMPWRTPTAISVALGGLLIGAGVALGMIAFRQLGRALTPNPVPLPGAGLRTDGVYARVRHPIYSAVLLLALGFIVAVGSWASAAVGVLLLVFFLLKSRWEDRLLAAEYGQAWDVWAKRTGALIPRRKTSAP